MGFNNVKLGSFGSFVNNKPTSWSSQSTSNQPSATVDDVLIQNPEVPVMPSVDTTKVEIEETLSALESECSIGNVVMFNTISTIENINKKIVAIKKELNNKIVNRKDVIDVLFLALLSRQHVVLYGPPGTGKTYLIEELNNRIVGSKYFQWQINKTTDTSELFGPFSIKEMENDKFLRKTDGMLPDANIAYLDEIYKGNSAVLNSLLSIMNERVFYNDGKPKKTELMSIFASSNERPQDENLEAFEDRFVFKMNVEYTKNKTEVKQLLTSVYGNKKDNTTTITLSDLKFMCDKVEDIKVPAKILDTITELITELKSSDFYISDRKIIQCIEIMKANALLNNKDTIDEDDLESIVYIIHDVNEPKSIRLIDSIIDKYKNPDEAKIKEFDKDFKDIIKDLSTKSTSEEIIRFVSDNLKNLNSIITEINTKLKVGKLNKKATKTAEDLLDKVNKIKTYLNEEVILNGNTLNMDTVTEIMK